MHVVKADISHLSMLTTLFEAYRAFYQQQPDAAAAEIFLQHRLDRQESIIFIALDDAHSTALGFTQLYPCFSSISLKRIYILNDLYVNPAYRKQNIARQLMRAAKEYALENQAAELILSTAITNTTAQKLYEAEGYQRNIDFYEYALKLGS